LGEFRGKTDLKCKKKTEKRPKMRRAVRRGGKKEFSKKEESETRNRDLHLNLE